MANYDREADATRVIMAGRSADGGVTPGGVMQLSPTNQDLLVQQRDLIGATATAAAGSAVTLTIPAGAAGIFNYLSFLDIQAYAAAALTGAATPVTVTTTGILGTPSWRFATAAAIGTLFGEVKYEGHAPVKGTAAATAMTIVCPATPNVIWTVNAAYFRA